jgi:excisionase family DNA binding protein
MAKPLKDHTNDELERLFDRFHAQLVSPGGAAALLGISRKTVYTLCERGDMRAFRPEGVDPRGVKGDAAGSWVYIPIKDVVEYGDRVGRSLPRLRRQIEEMERVLGPMQ